ncbi:MAG TPA: ATP-binding protein [Holophagaceae bacterium]|nr:ATP-binding protein [Holophagaceae bacterium]
MSRRSLLRDLRLAFFMAALLLMGLLPMVVWAALEHSLAAEDEAVLTSQGKVILAAIHNGTLPQDSGPVRLQTTHWCLLDRDGRVLRTNDASGLLQRIDWPPKIDEPYEDDESGRRWALLILPAPEGQLRVAMDRSHEEAVLRRFRNILLAVLGTGALGAAILGHFVAQRGLRPLARIKEDAARIEAGALDRRLDAEAFPEELAELVDALNEALGRLHVAFVRLEQLAGDLAHELRTPLQNLRLELEGMVLRPRAPEIQREAIGSVLEELDRLGSMVEQMLFLARSGVPGAALRQSDLHAGAVLHESAAFFSAVAEEAKVALVVEAPEDLLIHADPQLLHRALQNLLANALRHTPPGGHVSLRALSAGEWVRIQVEDDGEGIPADLMPRIGVRFARAEDSRERGRGGVGLGLAIVKGIMDLHDGTFTISSREGGGTTVQLSFPAPKRA